MGAGSCSRRAATHADLQRAIVAVAERNDYALDFDVAGTGFTAVVARDLKVIANKRGSGEETFYCQASNDDLLRMLATTTCSDADDARASCRREHAARRGLPAFVKIRV